jgi:4-amino-4-deoxy-L-arabinose transferase-like glycosyltransferase
LTKRWKPRLATVAICSLFIIAFVTINSPSLKQILVDPDQGTSLAIAQQISKGKHPFIDIHRLNFGPLVYYLSAIGQALTGNRLIGEIGLETTGYFFSYLLLLWLFFKITKNHLLSLFLLVFSIILMPRFYKYYIVLGPVIFLSALWLYLEKNSLKNKILLGISVAVTGFFRYDFGIYVCLVVLLSILISRDRNKNEKIRELVPISFSIAVPVLAWLSFIAIKYNIVKFFKDIFRTVISVSSGMSKPLPLFNFGQAFYSDYNLFSFLFWTFLFIPLLSTSYLFLIKDHIHIKERKFIFLASVFYALVYIQALHRTSIHHFLQVIPISFLLLGWMIKKIGELGIKKLPKLSGIILILFLLMGISAVNLFHYKYFLSLKSKIISVSKNFHTYLMNRESIRAFLLEEMDENKRDWALEVVCFINNNSNSKESVLFIPYHPQLYYFSERIFSTPFGWFFPGFFSNLNNQIEFSKKLDDTKFIVDLPKFSFDRKSERSAHNFMPFVMNYIYENYKIVRRIGPAVILEKGTDPQN